MGSFYLTLVLLLLLLLLLVQLCLADPDPVHESFLQCFSWHTSPTTNLSEIIHGPNTPSYSSLLLSSLQNTRFTTAATPKPVLIVSPTDESQVQAAVLCSRMFGMPIRTRSGGHDYEGLSYRSSENAIFVMVDMANLRSVTVDVDTATAWVEAGAIVGDLYYRIAEKSATYGFPAGICPTIGVGGHLSGGGFGTLLRKYGVAADHIIDTKMVDAKGRLLDRESMGEDLFWAIRGGGGASFGIIIAYKVSLVPVPATVTVFTVQKTTQLAALPLLHKWQQIGHKLHEDLFIEAALQPATNNGSKEVQCLFNGMYLGDANGLLRLLDEEFPELGVTQSDCKEVSWIQSVMYYAGYRNGQPLEALMDRSLQPKVYVKGKSDFVRNPIPLCGWEGIWNKFMEDGAGPMYMDPFGAKMDEIPESAIPFPHRKGNLFNIQYLTVWFDGADETAQQHMGWMSDLHDHMTQYASKFPRAAYLNFRDLDLGRNKEVGCTSYLEAEVWGQKYFKCNFKRLAIIKGKVDPENYFRYEQSIPPLHAKARTV